MEFNFHYKKETNEELFNNLEETDLLNIRKSSKLYSYL